MNPQTNRIVQELKDEIERREYLEDAEEIRLRREADDARFFRWLFDDFVPGLLKLAAAILALALVRYLNAKYPALIIFELGILAGFVGVIAWGCWMSRRAARRRKQ